MSARNVNLHEKCALTLFLVQKTVSRGHGESEGVKW